jgi:CRP-like cAMP-binding protein
MVADDEPLLETNLGIDFKVRQEIISSQPFFATFSQETLTELTQTAQEIHYRLGDIIVNEGDFVNSIFFIVQGKAKIIKKQIFANQTAQEVIITTICEGESIGIDSKGFFSTTGRHAATAIALTDLTLLKLNIKDFTTFIKKHPILDRKIEEFSELMLRLDLIKQAYPFCNLNDEFIYSLAQEIKELTLPPDSIIFKQGDAATCCYLIQRGHVEIFIAQNGDKCKQLTVLESPKLFGEAALMTSEKRNASARTLDETHLLVLDRALMLKLMKSDPPFALSVVGFMLNRLRPVRNEHIKIHRRVTKDEQTVITLQNTELHQFYQLTEQYLFIWEQLDGVQTLRDITIAFFKQYQIFAPGMICVFIYTLAETQFVTIPFLSVDFELNEEPKTKTQKCIHFLRKLCQKEFVFTQTDLWLSKIYQRGVWLCYTWPLLLFFMIIIVSGFITFIVNYANIIHYAGITPPNFWLFLILLIPVSTFTILLHEAGHAFTAKKFGYKVQRLGIGLFFLTPIVFADVSELWLADQLPRISVDIAGMIVDLLVAGTFALFTLLVNHQTAIYLWLFSLLIFYNAFKNLNCIQEYDGYFLLNDILDRYQLNKSSFKWLTKELPNNFKNIAFLRKHLAELGYWITCLLYLLCSCFFMYLVLDIIFSIFLVHSFLGIEIIYISISTPLLILSLSFLGIGIKIKRYKRLTA